MTVLEWVGKPCGEVGNAISKVLFVDKPQLYLKNSFLQFVRTENEGGEAQWFCGWNNVGNLKKIIIMYYYIIIAVELGYSDVSKL